MRPALPIEEALPALRGALSTHSSALLQAPPGAGKSTLVPLALLQEDWARGKRLLMLEPRRLAARAIASRMAALLGEAAGGTVGYRMRLDTRVSAATRIEVVTEGVLTRLLQEDPALEGVAAVIFDEFHERSLQADVGLALCLDARTTLAAELRVLIMSATLDVTAVTELLEDAPLISAPGRMFPVQTVYAGRSAPLLPAPGARGRESADEFLAQLVQRALREHEGDVLVFLPGAREIRRLESLLAPAVAAQVRLLPLFGELSAQEQDAALAPAPSGARKVVLATNIAETSLTIPGVRVVVDSGLMRRARFDPASGMSGLTTQRISRASAEQRQGRAGRTAPGVCYRAWSEGAQAALAAFTPAEIQDADLAPLALELAAWGARDAGALRWLEAPPPAALASARALLERLTALEADGRISAHGRQMARLPVHPRLAHMLLRGRELRSLPLAAQLAALLSERDLLRGPRALQDADVRTRVDMLRGEHDAPGAERGALERARRAARDLQRALRGTAADDHEGAVGAGVLLGCAYPDRIARRRPGGGGRYMLANGRGALFAEAQPLAQQEFLVAVEVDDREREARILLACPLTRAELLEHFAARIRVIDSLEWSPREQAVLARRITQLDALQLDDAPLPQVPAAAAQEAMLAGIRELGLAALPWDEAARDLQARSEWVRRALVDAGGWPALSDAALFESLSQWLGPYLEGITRREHLARIPLAKALAACLSFEQQRQLAQWAPTHLTVPSSARVRIDYQDASAPLVSVKLQELFGLPITPRLGPAAVPVTFRLLSPAQRPLQVTRDLESFWRGAYPEVRRQMRGRYPKHDWPEDPRSARPSRAGRRPR